MSVTLATYAHTHTCLHLKCLGLSEQLTSCKLQLASPTQHIMANYYHEARAHAKNIRLMQDDNRKRAERRAEKAGVEVK